jgi:hypothetical protein
MFTHTLHHVRNVKTTGSVLAIIVAAAVVLVASAPLSAQSETTRRSAATATTQQQEEPAQGSLATRRTTIQPRNGGPVIANQPAPQYLPTLSQLGSSSAYVPMKHGSAGIDLTTHVLAVQNGNLDMSLKVGMSCPAGRTVTHLSFKPQGQNATSVVGFDTGQQVFSKTLDAKPFSKSELESTCKQALGGVWASNNPHPNVGPEVKKTIVKSVNVWGQCSGWANKTKRTYPVSLTLTCRDLNPPYVPVG